MADADILTSLQNAVQAVNTLSQTWITVAGAVTSPAYSADVVLTTKQGRVAYVSVIAGGTSGFLHNCQTIAAATDANKLMAIPSAPGTYLAMVNFNNGLLLRPGAGQLVCVTYSLTQVQAANQ